MFFLPLPMTASPKSVSVILSEAFALVRQLLAPLLVGALLFSVVSALLAGAFAFGAAGVGIERFEQRMQEYQERLEAANQRLAAGDATALNDLAVPDIKDEAIVSGVVRALPTIMGGVLLLILVSIVARAYVTTVLVRRPTDVGEALKLFWNDVIPLTLLWLWLVVRSFVWIPVVGWVIAIVIVPRFVAAPLFLLEHKKGVTESAHLSLNATVGAWLRIVLPCLAAAILAGLVSMVLHALLGNDGLLMGFVLTLVGELLGAWVMAVGIVVARDVLAHPTAKVVAA